MTIAAKTTGVCSGVFWTAALVLFSIPSAVFAAYWAWFGISLEPSIFHSPAVVAGIVFPVAGGVYGIIELIRRVRRRPPLYFLPFGTLLVFVALLGGALLVANGLRAMKRSAHTQILEDLRNEPTTNTQ